MQCGVCIKLMTVRLYRERGKKKPRPIGRGFHVIFERSLVLSDLFGHFGQDDRIDDVDHAIGR